MAAFWHCQACNKSFASFRSAATSLVASMARDMRSSSNCWVVVKLIAGAEHSMSATQMPHSEAVHPRPYVTVHTDDKGGACWAVVGLGQVVQCYTGSRAMAVMESMCLATGVVTPS